VPFDFRKIDIDALRAALDYDPATGLLTWRKYMGGRAPAGRVAGTRCSSGHLNIKLFGATWAVHRLAWAHYYGEMPAAEIDHINRDPRDNRIANLRTVSRSENRRNSDIFDRNRAKGVPIGATRTKSGKWSVQARFAGRPVYAGVFDTAEAAEAAYLNITGAGR
jgi:hypothetical protein